MSPSLNDPLAGVPPNIAGFLDALERKFNVIPGEPSTKKPYLAHHKDRDGETVGRIENDTAGWKPYQDRRVTAADVERWLTKWPDANPLLLTGHLSSVIVLDLDGERAHDLVQRQHGNLPITVVAETPGGKEHYHYYYRYPTDVGEYVHGFVGSTKKFTSCSLCPGADLRADGGYVLYPGSLHKSGGIYEFLPGFGPGEREIAEAPLWILAEAEEQNRRYEAEKQRLDIAIENARLRAADPQGEHGEPVSIDERKKRYAAAMLRNAIARVESAPRTGRNDQLFRSAADLGAPVGEGLLAQVDVEIALERASYACGLAQDDGLGQIRQTIASGLRKGRHQSVTLDDRPSGPKGPSDEEARREIYMSIRRKAQL